MAVLTSKLILELLDRVSGPAKKVGAAVTALTSLQAKNSAMIAATSQKLFLATAAAYGMAKGIGAPIRAAMEFESAMADVKKVVDFEAPDGLAKLGATIIEMSKRIPIAATGLAKISAAAGSSGMKEGEIPAFTEMVAKLATAFDMTAEDAGEAMAKIKTGLGYTVEQTGALADAFNHLSNNMAAKAPQIIDYMKRVGVSGKQYGFSAEQTAALGAAMIAAGAESEVAATSFRNIGKALSKADNVSKDTEAAFRKLGLTSMGVTKAMQKNAVGTFKAVLKRVAKLPKHLQKSVLTQIFGEEARGMDPLVDNVKLLDDSLGMVASKTNYLGSAEKEFQARTETTANAVKLTKNRLEALSIAIGVALLPGVRNATTAMNPLIERLTKFVEANPELVRAVTLTAGALIGIGIAGQIAKLGIGFIWGGLLATGVGALKLLSGALWLVKAALFPFAAAFRAARAAMLGFAAVAKILGVGGALKMIGRSALGILGPIGLLAAAGLLIYENWDKVKEALSWVNDKIKDLTGVDLYETGARILKSLWEGMKSIWAGLLDWAKGLGSSIKNAIMGGGAAASSAGAPAVAGARAAGGPVRAGSTYLVGERGPELFRPSLPGSIASTHATVQALKAQALAGAAARAGGGSGGGTVNYNIGGIHVQAGPGQSPEAIAAAVERRLSDKLNQLSRGAYSDGAYS